MRRVPLMAGVWTQVLPYAVGAAVLTSLLRPRYLAKAEPGVALRQRLGLLLTTAPLYLLVLVGLTSVPRLFAEATALAVPSQALAGKAVLHFLLYLAVPVVGLILVLGPRRSLRKAPEALFGHREAGAGLSRGLTHATGISALLVAGVLLGWSSLADQAGLFSAEGPRVFFSNTTPTVALVLAGVAAIAEELLFRGVLLGHLRRRAGLHAAVWIQAGLFGLIHAGYGSLLHVGAAATFGVLLGYLANRDGLVPAMLVHFTVNVAVLAAWSEQVALLAVGFGFLAALAVAAFVLRVRDEVQLADPQPTAGR